MEGWDVVAIGGGGPGHCATGAHAGLVEEEVGAAPIAAAVVLRVVAGCFFTMRHGRSSGQDSRPWRKAHGQWAVHQGQRVYGAAGGCAGEEARTGCCGLGSSEVKIWPWRGAAGSGRSRQGGERPSLAWRRRGSEVALGY